MFSGRAALNLDAKGRLAIPAKQREKLAVSCDGQVVLTKHPFDNCLSLYPLPEWEQVSEKVAKLPDSSNSVRELKRRFIGEAVEMRLDGSGRILVPAELRGLIGLDKEAMLIGQMHRFEIWAASTWDEQFSEPLNPDDLPEISF